MSSPILATLDFGGTFIKASLFSVSDCAEPLDCVKFRFPYEVRQERSEISSNPNSVIEIALRAVRSLLSRNNNPKLAGALVSGQMGSYLFVDSDGTPITGISSWQNQVSTAYLESVPKKLREDIFHLGGDFVRRELPALKLLESRAGRSGRFETLLSFVAKAMTGGRSEIIHITDAAATGMLNTFEGTWNEDLLGLLGLSLSDLPRVTSHFETAGFSKELGCPVWVGVGDHQAAVNSSNSLENGGINVNIGTGCQVSRVRLPGDDRTLQTRPYFRGTFLTCLTHISSGRYIERSVNESAQTASQRSAIWRALASSEELHVPEIVRYSISEVAKEISAAIDTVDDERALHPIEVTGGLGKIAALQKELGRKMQNRQLVFHSHLDSTSSGLVKLWDN